MPDPAGTGKKRFPCRTGRYRGRRQNIVHCRPGTGTGRKGETGPRRDDDSYVPAGTVWRIDLSALGQPLQAVCFRWDEASDAARRFGRSCPPEAADGEIQLSIQLFARLWQNCCLAGIIRDIPVLPVLNQADTPQHRIAASLILQEMDLPAGLITSFVGNEGIPCI